MLVVVIVYWKWNKNFKKKKKERKKEREQKEKARGVIFRTADIWRKLLTAIIINFITQWYMNITIIYVKKFCVHIKWMIFS